MSDPRADAGVPDDDRMPTDATQRLARLLGAHLRTPLPTGRRDVLAARLAVVAQDADASQAPSRWQRIVRRPASLVAAVAALALIVAAVGVVTRTAEELPVIVLAAGGPGSGSSGPMAADAGPGSDALRGAPAPEGLSMMWEPTRYTFVLADGVGVDVDRAPAWRFTPPDAADLAADAARLAEALGLPAPAPAEGDPGSWSVQREDGANLWVASSGDWYFGGPWDLWSVWDCPVPEPREGSDEVPAVDAECVAPEPPPGVPSEARARELAIALLGSLGVDDVRVTDVFADEWSAWVTIELPLPDGSGPSGLTYGVGFAGEERLASASGTFVRLERLGDYPLVDVASSLPRLETELNAWLDQDPAMRPMPLPAVEPGEGEVGILPLPEPAPVPDESLPTEPFEMPEPVDRTVTIVEAELVMSTAWAADDILVLLPHYRLTDADGGWWWVVAVADGYVTR